MLKNGSVWVDSCNVPHLVIHSSRHWVTAKVKGSKVDVRMEDWVEEMKEIEETALT